MSFWGATVITNLASAIPCVGENIAKWLWGGFSIDNATLNRLFSLHYTLSFVLAGLSLVHLVFLHLEGSTNPLGVCSKMDKITFFPYFVYKDIFGVISILVGVFTFYVFFLPNYLGHPDNYIPANPLVTPTHIVPEWYEREAYARTSRVEVFTFKNKYFTNIISLTAIVLYLITQFLITLSDTIILLTIELYYLVEPLIKKFLILITCRVKTLFALKRCSSDILVCQDRMFNRFEYGVQIRSIHANFSFVNKNIASEKQVENNFFLNTVIVDKPFLVRKYVVSSSCASLKLRKKCNEKFSECFLVDSFVKIKILAREFSSTAEIESERFKRLIL